MFDFLLGGDNIDFRLRFKGVHVARDIQIVVVFLDFAQLGDVAEFLAAFPLPVSGDFENGFGDTPETVAETVRLAAEIGLSGCSIEDTNMADHSAYSFDLTVERIHAGASQARALGRPFVFCARAD